MHSLICFRDDGSLEDKITSMEASFTRWYPVGAQVAEGGTHFRVWAPPRQAVQVVSEGSSQNGHELTKESDGYFTGFVPGVQSGNRYAYRVDGQGPFPDPASRFQPEGPLGFSQVVDPTYTWTDSNWRGVTIEGQVVYEMHIGTFTREGTYRAAMAHLASLKSLGVTLLELMPVADFTGNFGWGYDGVDLFAPTRLYGTPDDLRAFIDHAHSLELGVILDVVYNHIGPRGNFLAEFSPFYFSDKHSTDWGGAMRFYGPCSGPVRQFFVANAAYWIREYHFDGLRLDATQNIYDRSAEHILAEIARNCREAAESRGVVLIAENESQNNKLLKPPEQCGYGLDALWNDDFHHSAMVALTGRREAYYTDYRGNAQELLSCAKYGFLYQGQWYKWQKQRRGTPVLRGNPAAMINFIENHDQVANSSHGLRVHALTMPGTFRAMTAVLLLIPGTPMLFQGQEFASTAPFVFFADHEDDLARTVRKGRADFLAQWRSLATGAVKYADPCSPATFERCKLDQAEREQNVETVLLHSDLLRLRREIRSTSHRMDGAVLANEAFLLRFFGDEPHDRLLIVNLGAQLNWDPAPEPLLAPPEGCLWETLWSSEDPRYGGDGTPPLDSELNWIIPAHAAVLLEPKTSPVAEARDE